MINDGRALVHMEENGMVKGTYNLNRFIVMQQAEYQTALSEIKAGQKRSHWMWYIFPQIAGLGHSMTAKMYEIERLEEAREYMDNEYLRNNLVEITRAVLECENDDIEYIMGYPDNLKLCSCMTLFEIVAPSIKEFGQVLDRFFGGKRDERTIALVNRPKTIGYQAPQYYNAKDYRDYRHITAINGVLEDFAKQAQSIDEPDWYIKGASLYFTYENEYYVIWPGDVDTTPGVFDRMSYRLIDALYDAGASDMFYAGMMD